MKKLFLQRKDNGFRPNGTVNFIDFLLLPLLCSNFARNIEMN